MLFVLFALSAQDLCKRCLQYNASSASAHETLGAILERECAYKDAAECYEKAWRFTHQGSAATGYLLAFNYLKVRTGLPADPSKVRVPQGADVQRGVYACARALPFASDLKGAAAEDSSLPIGTINREGSGL